MAQKKICKLFFRRPPFSYSSSIIPLKPTSPFLSEAFLGKRTKIWVSDDPHIGLPGGKSVLSFGNLLKIK